MPAESNPVIYLAWCPGARSAVRGVRAGRGSPFACTRLDSRGGDNRGRPQRTVRGPLRRVGRSRGLPDGHHRKWKGCRAARSNPGQRARCPGRLGLRIGTRPIPATLACEVDSRRGFLGRVHPLHGRAVMLVEAMTFAQRTGGADTARNLPAGADAAATDRLGHGHHRGRHSARPCTDRVAPWCRRHWPACRCTRPTRISPFSADRRGAGGIEAGRGSSSGDQSETRQAMKMSV